MPATIHIPASNRRFGGFVPVGINGQVRKIPVGVDYLASDDEIAALNAAGITIAQTVVPEGQILIPSSMYGPRIPIGINGVVSYLLTGASFAPSTAQLAALDGKGIVYRTGGTVTPTPSPSPTLSALTLAAPTVVENTAAGTTISGILGTTMGSVLSLTDTAGGRFALSGGNLATGATNIDYDAATGGATSYQVTVRETLANATNSPRDTVLTVAVTNVFEQPSLSPLSLSATAFTVGTASSGSITGATAGSTITASGLPSGLTINGPARTWAWSGSGSAGSSTVTLTETLADSANSPRSSDVGVTVSAATSPMVIPYGASFVALGDSLISQKSNAKSIDNPVALAIFDLKGHLRALPAADQGIGGNTTTQMNARVANTAKQRPDVLFRDGGENDGLSTSTPSTISTAKANIDADLAAVWAENPGCIVVWQPLTYTTSQTQVSKDAKDQINAYVQAKENLTSAGSRLAYVAPPTIIAADYNDGVGPHFSAAGAQKMKAAILAKLAPHLGTAGNILTETTASGYRGANLHPRTGLAGTNGTMSGTGTLIGSGTGVAASCTITSTVAGLTITASKGTRGPQGVSQIIDVVGTVTTAGTITWSEGNVTINGVQGDLLEYAIGARMSHTDGTSAPVGLNNAYANAGSGGVAGLHFTSSRSSTDNAPAIMDGVFRTWPAGLRTTSTAIPGQVVVAFRNGDAVNLRIELFSPIMRKVDLAAYAPVAYTQVFITPLDGIKTANESLRLTGTLSGGAGTLTIEPGTKSGGGITTGVKRIYKGGSAGLPGIGTGSMLGSAIAAGTWTWTATGVAAGDTLYVEEDDTNSFGTVTSRSWIGYTAA